MRKLRQYKEEMNIQANFHIPLNYCPLPLKHFVY